MLEELFANAGWFVRAEPVLAQGEILSIVRRSRFDLVGFTVSCPELLDRLPELISCVRAASLNREVRIMLGGNLFLADPDLALRLGADATASDAREALLRAKALVARDALV